MDHSNISKANDTTGVFLSRSKTGPKIANRKTDWVTVRVL